MSCFKFKRLTEQASKDGLVSLNGEKTVSKLKESTEIIYLTLNMG